ncbi:MAG: acyltransferase [Bacteroidales bacterium]
MISKLAFLAKKILYRLQSNHTTECLIERGLKVGANFSRLHGVILDPAHCWLIEIGDDVTMAPRVHILAHDASLCNHLGYARIGQVIIGNNVFIGAESVVLPNVRIGNNVIIGANSTVSKDIPDGVVVAGSPARVICTTEEYLAKNRELMKSRPIYGEEYTTRSNVSQAMKQEMKDALKDGFGFVK